MAELSTADVLEITGLTEDALRNWCEQEIVVPINSGEGTGRHRRFSLMQTLGLAVGNAVRTSERGCVLSYVQSVVTVFEALSEKKLQNHFDNGATHFQTVYGSRLILDGKRYADSIDVEGIYNGLKKKIVRLQKAPANATGRNRGLASK